ncbi:thiamine biosynthesis lipoprotein [Raineyella antarctica]|uniref:FAD:protein FMN transferase n=1 Tax=Raineyella antarctica TaxID=1577474 RepID=A0A1G6H8N3_9ACTN|nr:FAD:protein FMN transferase [Raineyella antarctica]SDB90647.1 thiamine biosynthesis lipoprotein [Raineyella antarctica]
MTQRTDSPSNDSPSNKTPGNETPGNETPGNETPTVTQRRPAGRRYTHLQEMWGTVVVIDLVEDPDEWPADEVLEGAITEAVELMRWVDRVFSTYRQTSLVSALRAGRLAESDLDAGDPDQASLMEVIAACRWGRTLTAGRFDPWAAPGGFDPSGYVKGWAAELVADLLVGRGFGNVSVNAGGDVVTRGRPAPGEAWRIGIRHPDDPEAIIGVEEVTDGAVATSGAYERGDHIVDPATGLPATGARSATVVAPHAGLAEILSTALVVGGRDGAIWVASQHGCRAHVVDPAPAMTAWSTSWIGDRLQAVG